MDLGALNALRCDLKLTYEDLAHPTNNSPSISTVGRVFRGTGVADRSMQAVVERLREKVAERDATRIEDLELILQGMYLPSETDVFARDFANAMFGESIEALRARVKPVEIYLPVIEIAGYMRKDVKSVHRFDLDNDHLIYTSPNSGDDVHGWAHDSAPRFHAVEDQYLAEHVRALLCRADVPCVVRSQAYGEVPRRNARIILIGWRNWSGLSAFRLTPGAVAVGRDYEIRIASRTLRRPPSHHWGFCGRGRLSEDLRYGCIGGDSARGTLELAWSIDAQAESLFACLRRLAGRSPTACTVVRMHRHSPGETTEILRADFNGRSWSIDD